MNRGSMRSAGAGAVLPSSRRASVGINSELAAPLRRLTHQDWSRVEPWKLSRSQALRGAASHRASVGVIPSSRRACVGIVLDALRLLGSATPAWLERVLTEQDDGTIPTTTLLRSKTFSCRSITQTSSNAVLRIGIIPSFLENSQNLASTAKASASKTSTSKKSTSKTKHPEGLGYVLYTLIWAGERFLAQQTEDEEDEEEDEDAEDDDDAALPLPPVLRAFADKSFPPLWLPDCPEDCEAWKDHWEELRKKFPRDVEYSNDALKAKFGKSDAETFFATEAVKHGWLTILDTLITSQLESSGHTFRVYYADTGFETSRVAGKYPHVDAWSGDKLEVLRFLFGADVVRQVLPYPLTIWWGYVMSKYVEREKATAGRQRTRYDTLCKKITGFLGENFLMGSDDAAKKFTPRELTQAIKLLRQCSETLEWEILTKGR
ncbi:hypothetical protein C8F04DRAFT_1196843 [Mycena alexandri]|uniref:Uncharacterized protein n=1 Tax=Mycena alexandri TaxID=1745969 RepID=A0AAD6WQU9_9AGAR|nr:hypothetical protein C8F04DRAFT_1196843 [Mycena alexandri]